MIKGRLRVAPGEPFAQLAHDKGFQQAPQQGAVFAEPAGVRADQVTRQAGIHQVQLGRLDQALTQIGRPGREAVNQEHRFQKGQAARQGRMRQPRVTPNIREVQQARRAG
ncbi:MAG TPA: hypothetical protein VES73_11585, partial [Lamprocystis sp. (in: g-proteobacteria)]|nr:hypothetical protein [Lamprocystis sp. (in: g-proteobacteria)]